MVIKETMSDVMDRMLTKDDVEKSSDQLREEMDIEIMKISGLIVNMETRIEMEERTRESELHKLADRVKGNTEKVNEIAETCEGSRTDISRMDEVIRMLESRQSWNASSITALVEGTTTKILSNKLDVVLEETESMM